MHVGMEEAVANGMAQKTLDDRDRRGGRDRGRGLCSAAMIGERRAVDPFGGEHLPRGAAASRPRARGSPDHRRYSRAISFMAAASMRRSISSLTDCASVSTASTGRRRLGRRAHALDQARGEEEIGEIAGEALLDAGTQDLHRHIAAFVRPGAMHLRDRGGGNRRAEFA